MGTWGAALYDDDAAGDLRTSIALLAKVPADGNRLLAMLRQAHDDPAPDSEDGCIFWLVVADQFERKGIDCEEATRVALQIIKDGTDIRHCLECDADAKFIVARKKVLDELAARLCAPRPKKPVKKPGKPPALVLTTGEVYAFPTMNRRAWHPYRLDSDGPFQPDGWGALVVLATGRAFDWLPWVSVAALSVRPDVKPTFEEALAERLMPHPQTHGAARFVPKAAHAKGLGLELLGTVQLDPGLVAPQLSTWPIETAIQYDWTFCYGALSSAALGMGLEATVPLKSLLAHAR